jgi:hypothetical protein
MTWLWGDGESVKIGTHTRALNCNSRALLLHIPVGTFNLSHMYAYTRTITQSHPLTHTAANALTGSLCL